MDPLIFVPGAPSIVELSAKRHVPVDKARRGQMVTQISTSLILSEDKRTLLVRISVGVKGVADEKETPAFDASCIAECEYVFREELQQDALEDETFNIQFVGPVYQRAALQLQDIAWRMGYSAVRVPLVFSPDEVIEPEVAPLPPAKKSRKKKIPQD